MNRILFEPQITALAKSLGYQLEKREEGSGLLIFIAPGVQVNVYTTRMTVATSLHHPKHGRTQLFRKGVSMADLRKIFENPRAHLGNGYRARGARP